MPSAATARGPDGYTPCLPRGCPDLGWHPASGPGAGPVRALRITMVGCEALQRVKPRAYLGYRILEDGRIEHHLVRGRRRLVRLRVDCDRCVLGRLLKASAVVSTPVVIDGRLVRFLVLDSREARRIVGETPSRLVSVEQVELENLVLTDRQRHALRLAADGAGPTPSRLARALGVTRQAAQRLLKTVLRKASILLT